jgi:hypothetical protein
MSRWNGRRWGLVIGSVLVILGAVVVVIYAVLYNIAADVRTRNRSIGCLKRHENTRSQPERGTLSSQTIWMTRTASQEARGVN